MFYVLLSYALFKFDDLLSVILFIYVTDSVWVWYSERLWERSTEKGKSQSTHVTIYTHLYMVCFL